METLVVKKKKGVQYFTQETEDAIVRYNSTSDTTEKNKIYERLIELENHNKELQKNNEELLKKNVRIEPALHV